MFLAPLNYDRYFKKVFSDIEIAKKFLEDFLDVSIETIAPLSKDYKITDTASGVEFDFRCKINGQYVVIDMQQWYKTDIVKRFYLYHAVNTAVQLEHIPTKETRKIGDKIIELKNYNLLEPVITLIWLADETLSLKEDFVSYIMTPETVNKFLRNKSLWENPDIEALMAARQTQLDLMDNKTKGIDFLSQNRLIYAFQKNIVKNKKFSKYFAWFDFAEKTRQESNIETDFDEYKTDKYFNEIIKRLNREGLADEDDFYILNYREAMVALNRVAEENFEEGVRKTKADLEPLIAAEREKAEQEREKAEQEAEQKETITVLNLLKFGMTAEQVAETLQITIEKIITIQTNKLQ